MSLNFEQVTPTGGLGQLSLDLMYEQVGAAESQPAAQPESAEDLDPTLLTTPEKVERAIRAISRLLRAGAPLAVAFSGGNSLANGCPSVSGEKGKKNGDLASPFLY